MRTLNIGGSATLKAYVKFNAKADKWFFRSTDGEEKEIKRPNFVIDFENFAEAWMRLREGQAPERVMDPAVGKTARRPGEDFKRGFIVMVYSPKFFAGAAEFSSASFHLCNAIKDLYADYETGKATNPDKLPVIACTGSQAMKDRYGTNYRPQFAIVLWVDRPADLPNVSPVEASDKSHGSPVIPANVGTQHLAEAPQELADDVPF